jgi:hypothetical protein
MNRIYDKRGIPVCAGDVLKVLHYKSGSRNVYMYKWVLEIIPGCRDSWWYVLSHLTAGKVSDSYRLVADNKPDLDLEILQGYAETENCGYDFRRRAGRIKMKGGR